MRRVWFVGGIAAAVLAGLLILLLQLEQGRLKGTLEAWLSATLGRSVAIRGDAGLRIRRIVRFKAAGLRVSNAAWGSRAEMLAADEILIEADLWSLLRGPAVIHRLDIGGLDLLLERSAAGEGNWETGEPGAAGWPDTLPFVLQHARLNDARIQYRDPRLDRAVDMRLASVEQQHRADDRLLLGVEGEVNGTALSLRADAGAFAQLVAGKNFDLDARARIGDLDVQAAAVIDDVAAPVRSRLSLRMTAPEAATLAQRLGLGDPGAGGVDLTSEITPLSGRPGLSGRMAGTFGGLAIDADGEMADPRDLTQFRLRLAASGPSLGLLTRLLDLPPLPADAFRLAARADRNAERLDIAEATLELADARFSLHGTVTRPEDFTGVDLQLAVTGSDIAKFRQLLHLPGVATGPFELSGRVTHTASSDAEQIDLTFSSGLGRTTLRGALRGYPEFYGTRLAVDAAGSNFARVGQAFGVKGLGEIPFSISGNFEWTQRGALLHPASLRVGADQLTLEGRIGRDPLGPGTQVKFRAMGADLQQTGARLGFERWPSGAFDVNGRLQRQARASRLHDVRGSIGSARLRVNGVLADPPEFRGTRLDFEAEGPRLEAFHTLAPGIALPAGPFSVAGGLAWTEARVELSRMRWSAAGSAGEADLDIGLPIGAGSGRFDVSARGPDLQRWLPAGRLKGPPQRFDLTARGQWRGDRWSLARMALSLSDASLSLQGELDWVPDLSATALQVDARAEDLARIGRLFDLDLPASPMSLSARVSGDARALNVKQLNGRLGNSDVAGSISFTPGTKPEVDAQITAGKLDLTALGGPDGTDQIAKPADNRLIEDIRLPVGWLRLANGRMSLRAGKLLWAGGNYDDVHLEGVLQDGALTLDPLEFRSRRGDFKTRIEVVPDPVPPRVHAVVEGANVLGLVPGAGPAQDRTRFDLLLEATGRGATTRELAASLTGTLRMVGGPGRLETQNLRLLYGDFMSELLTSLNPFVKKQPYTNVGCVVYLLNAKDGVVTTAPALVVRTDEIDIVSQGHIDLRTETIDFNFKTAARKGIGIGAGDIINPYIKVAGTLAQPRITLDPKGALVTGGAAVATAGISVVARSVWDRLVREADPCAAVLAEAERGQGEQPKRKRLLGVPLPGRR
jgi:uncharacterized protein involved in outer membrane biogenesis